MSAMDVSQYESTDLRGTYVYPETLKGVHYGPGCLATALPKIMESLGVKRALIVTGKSLSQKVRIYM